MANNNNQQVEAVGATSNDSPNTQYYKQVYKTIGGEGNVGKNPNVNQSIYGDITPDSLMIAEAMANSKTGTVNPFLMMIMLNDYSTMYGMQLQTSQVFVVDSAQTLSDDYSKVLQDLQTLEGMYGDGKTDPNDYTGIMQSLTDDLQKLSDDIKQMRDSAADNLPEVPDGNGGWKPNPCTQDFNDMLDQAQNNLDAFFNVWAGPTNDVTDSLYYDISLGTVLIGDNPYGLSPEAFGYALSKNHQDTVDGKETDYPDQLDKLINGGIDLYWAQNGGTTTGSPSGLDPFVTTYLQSLMSRYSQTIQLDTGNINNIYDINKQITQSAQKEYGTYVQNQLAR